MYCCNNCGKVFNQLSHLNKHKERKYPCKEKDKLLETIDNMIDKKIKNLNIIIDESNITNMKKELGQFYTKNYDYILQNINIPGNISNIVEPFAGDGDLINYINKQGKNYNIVCFDTHLGLDC